MKGIRLGSERSDLITTSSLGDRYLIEIASFNFIAGTVENRDQPYRCLLVTNLAPPRQKTPSNLRSVVLEKPPLRLRSS